MRRLTIHDVREIEQLLAAGGSIRRVARQMKVSIGTVGQIRLGKHPRQLQPEQLKVKAPKSKRKPRPRPAVTRDTFTPAIDPTPEEIRERCAEIQRRKPRGAGRKLYSFPVLSQL